MRPTVLRIVEGATCNGAAKAPNAGDHATGRPPDVVTGSREQIFEAIRKKLLEPGGLVAIPTETVYGLAGNIHLNESICNIFALKNRPLKDPLIVHVDSFVYALNHLYDAGLAEAYVILELARKFTPGPLTIVSRCKQTVSKLLTGGTDAVAVRCPSNELCLRMLRELKLPLAAPSANKFGHISPTRPEHVLAEFEDDPIYVLDGGPCMIGIESTVVRVTATPGLPRPRDPQAAYEAIARYTRRPGGGDTDCEVMREVFDELDTCEIRLEVLRKGAVTVDDITDAFAGRRTVVVVENVQTHRSSDDCVSPGTHITHYAPNVPTYLVKTGGPEGAEPHHALGAELDAKRMVLVDAGRDFEAQADQFREYIPVDKDPETLANQLYALLRKAEAVALRDDGAEHACVVGIHFEADHEGLLSAIHDRVRRASSGNTVHATTEGGKVRLRRL